MITRRTLLGTSAALIAGRALAQDAAATYPTKVVTLIVPLAAGSVGDLINRIVANGLQNIWQTPVLIENRPGGGTNVGVAALARSRPDGYTLGEINIASHAINPFLYREKLPFDPLADFAPVSLSVTAALSTILVNSQKVPAKTVPEFVSYLKANPRKLTYASQGAGTTPHICMELFQRMTGTELIHVPYTNPGQLLTDTLSGVVEVLPDLSGLNWPNVQSGKLRAIAVTSPKRSDFAPELPALNEFYPGLEMISWRGVAAPKGTPAPIVEKIAKDMRTVLTDQSVIEKLRQNYLMPAPQSPEEFSSFIKSELTRLKPIVEQSGAQAG